MRILVLASDNPDPPINGTRIRNFYLWPELRKLGHDVKVLSLTRDKSDLMKSTPELEFFSFTRKPLLQRIWMRLFHSYHEWPVSDELSQRVVELERDWHPDVIHAEELRMGQYLPSRKATKALKSICAHNVESDLIRQTLAAPFRFGIKFFNHIFYLTLKRFEHRVFSAADVRMTYSEKDQKRYAELYPEFDFTPSSNGTNQIGLTKATATLPPADQLLFLGSLSYLPNIEGLFWLIDEVLPLVKRPVKLTVAGSGPADVVKERLGKLGIPLIDTPLDLTPHYQGNSALLVPLLSGSGTRGKILEALMYNRVVLTTSKGVEGLELATGEGVLSADGAKNFAGLIDQWIEMPTAEQQLIADRGRAAVEDRYTWKVVGQTMLKLWENQRAASSPSKN